VFIEDVRDNGTYLRTTWHPERRLFVVSTWSGEVCTGAVRLPAGEAAELATLLVDGLADATGTAPPATAPGAAPAAGPPGPPGPVVRRVGGEPTVGPRDAQGRPKDATPVPHLVPAPSPAGSRRPAGLPDWPTIRRWLTHRTSVPRLGRRADAAS
jgi:hypothetical protein